MTSLIHNDRRPLGRGTQIGKRTIRPIQGIGWNGDCDKRPDFRLSFGSRPRMRNELEDRASGAEVTLTRGVIVVGLAIFAYAGFEFVSVVPDLQWVWLAVVTILVVSRLEIHIPKTSGTIRLSDTFVFISLVLYGIAPSTVLAGLTAAVSSFQSRERKRIVAFNAAIMSLSIYLS